MILTSNNPVLAQAITIHPKMRRSPVETRLLKPVSTNKKMGNKKNIVAKGKWKGMPMFQLTLEERATCDSQCKQWAGCFGNNMVFAHRIDHTHPEFLPRLAAEIAEMAALYRNFVIRPHILGDFFSEEYAQFWMDQVQLHPGLHIFGFTHRQRTSPIGRIILEGNKDPRVWIRFSDQGGDMSANVEGEGIQCPEQTEKTESCLTCGICWTTTKPVRFIRH